MSTRPGPRLQVRISGLTADLDEVVRGARGVTEVVVAGAGKPDEVVQYRQ